MRLTMTSTLIMAAERPTASVVASCAERSCSEVVAAGAVETESPEAFLWVLCPLGVITLEDSLSNCGLSPTASGAPVRALPLGAICRATCPSSQDVAVYLDV